jgi:hypothetical protein
MINFNFHIRLNFIITNWAIENAFIGDGNFNFIKIQQIDDIMKIIKIVFVNFSIMVKYYQNQFHIFLNQYY